VEGLVIQPELELQRTVGDPAAPTEEIDDLI
jgi:hypothetical protein